MAINYSKDEVLAILARTGPSSMQKVLMDIERCLDGKIEYSDPSTPFILLLEAAAITQADATLAHHRILQKLYPKMANTKEDLYHSMTDDDFVGAFAYPSKGKMTIVFPLDAISLIARKIDGTNIKHVIIPEGTVFQAGEFRFMLVRCLDIRLMPKGGLQVIYNDSTLNDAFNFESNLVNYDIKLLGAKGITQKVLTIDIDVYQMRVISKEDTASSTSGYNQVIPIEEDFFMCRVYNKTRNGLWRPIKITHSKINYDITIPTATVQLLDKAVRIQIPDIYFTKNLISSTILVEVFTTKGSINLNLFEYGEGNTIKVGLPEGKCQYDTQPLAVAMLRSLTSALVMGNGNVVGGVNQPSFETLKERHIWNALSRKRPISDVEIRNRLVDHGFDVSLSEETVTKRLFLGSRELPAPETGNATPFATTTMATLYTTLNDLRISKRVIDNGKRLTILPSAIYSISGKNIQLLDDIVAENIEQMSADEISKNTSLFDYACTPFYHVVDSTGSTFDYRVYQLDSPSIARRSFIDINSTTEVTFGTSQMAVDFDEPNYTITVFSKPSGEFDTNLINKMFCQLTYTTPDGSYRGALNGRYVGYSSETGEYVWQFTINTGLDIDDKHRMHVKNILIKKNDVINTHMQLTQNFDLIYGITDYTTPGMQKTTMDKLVVGYKGEYVAMTHENVTITFGKHLDMLYTRSRSIKGNNIYKRYEEDIYARYEEDVYELDEVTKVPKHKEVNGKFQFVIKHKKGEPVLDEKGEPLIKHRAGDIILDKYGEAMIIDDGLIERTIDLFLVNAIYRFASQDNDKKYYQSIGNIVVGYMENFILPISKDIDNGTKIKFYPKVNLGDVLVRAGNDAQFTINSALPFTLRVALSEERYNSYSYREEIEQSIINILREQVKLRSISLNHLAKVISNSLGDEILGVSISCPYLSSEVPVYTLVNDTEVFTIARNLEKLANGFTHVNYNVKVEWVKQLI
jgi:hypothetical protein